VEKAIGEADVILVNQSVQPITPSHAMSARETGPDACQLKITRQLAETKAKPAAIPAPLLRAGRDPHRRDITKWSRYWQEAVQRRCVEKTLLALVRAME